MLKAEKTKRTLLKAKNKSKLQTQPFNGCVFYGIVELRSWQVNEGCLILEALFHWRLILNITSFRMDGHTDKEPFGLKNGQVQS